MDEKTLISKAMAALGRRKSPAKAAAARANAKLPGPGSPARAREESAMPKLDETGIGIEKATGRRTVRICVDGKRYFETMPEGATLGQACARRDDMRKEAAGGGLKPGAPLTIEGLLRLVEVDHAAKHVSRATVKKFATASRRLVAHFGADTPAARVKFSHLQEFRLQMQADYSIALTNVTLSFFSTGFGWRSRAN